MSDTDTLAALRRQHLEETHASTGTCPGESCPTAQVLAAGVTLDPRPSVAERIAAVALDPAYEAMLRENADLRNRIDVANARGVREGYRAGLVARPAPDTALREALDPDTIWLGVELLSVNGVTFSEPMVSVAGVRAALRAALEAKP